MAVVVPRRLDARQIACAMPLSAHAGWNQTAGDWALFGEFGTVFGVVEGDAVVATAALLPLPPRTAWIAMVLTHPDHRGHGHASTLLQAALAEADRLALTPMLDATPAGEPLYRALGFAGGPPLTRWRRPGPILPTCPSGADGTCDDAEATGWDRRALLDGLARRGRWFVEEGAALVREGRTATHIGPVLAAEPGQVLAAALGGVGGAIIDVFDDGPLPALLPAAGFVPERAFVRMARGEGVVPRPAYAAAAGPEFG